VLAWKPPHRLVVTWQINGQALDLPADQRIGPITQRAQDLLRELEPWRGRPAVEELRERVVAS
jgi:hypothetical protein